MIPMTMGLPSVPGGKGVASGVLVTSGVSVAEGADVSADTPGVAVAVQADKANTSAIITS